MSAANERDVVRKLAREVAELASTEANRAVVQRWKDVNELRKPDRAPVWCRPVGCWPELLPESELVCSDPWLRGIEHGFRKILVKHDIGDDSPLESAFPVSAVFDCEPENLWGVEVRHTSSSAEGGAWAYDPPLKTEEDFERLRRPRFRFNAERTQEALSRADGLLGDILPVEPTCGMRMSAILGHYAADLWGLSEMMMDMATQPELMHRLMAHLRDSVLDSMRVIAESGRLTRNNRGPMVYSDDFGPAPDADGMTFANLWCPTNSQEFDQVSPAMWEEFCLEYQRPILEQFGRVAYGCCENLTHKIDGVLSLPNLRIFVCSAWTDLDKVIERVGTDYTIMWRQKATDVVFAPGEAELRRDLEEGMRKLQGYHVQIVLRELQTLEGNTDRLHVWNRIATQVAEKYA